MKNKTSETLEQTKARHSKHQDMLKQHRLYEDARKEKSKNNNHKAYKQDSEMMGFKPLTVPKVTFYRAY